VHSLLRWQVRVNVVRSRIIYPNAFRNPTIGLERRSVNDAAKLDTISATPVLARSSNAAAQLPLRGQSEREALRGTSTHMIGYTFWKYPLQ